MFQGVKHSNAMKVILFSFLALAVVAGAQDPAALRSERDRMVKKGLWRELVDQYREKLSEVVDERSGTDLDKEFAVQAR